MKKFYRGSYIDASCQVWLHLAKQSKHVQHVKIYMPCNFEVNLITRLGVIALFYFIKHFVFNNTFCDLFSVLPTSFRVVRYLIILMMS
jgi:hypothetical protein